MSVFDYAVIGAGVVGIAVARQLTRLGFTVVVVERDADVLAHASGANSGILHSGFDAYPDLLETRLMYDKRASSPAPVVDLVFAVPRAMC